MKRTKFIILSLLFATLLLSAGCEGEERWRSGENAVRLVSGIEYYWNNNSGVAPYLTVEFRYDKQNRITEIAVIDEEGVTTRSIISYPAKNNVVISQVGNDMVVNGILNSDGYIASWSEGGQLIGTCSYANGYLQNRDYLLESTKISETFTWKNGNVTTMVRETSYLADPPWKYSSTQIFEYSSIQYKPCSIDFVHSSISGFYGMYGKSTQNLPSKVTTQSEFGLLDIVTTYRYETDKRDYPTRIFVQINEGSEQLTTVIKYEN